MVTKEHILTSDSNCVHYITHVKYVILKWTITWIPSSSVIAAKQNLTKKHKLTDHKERDHTLCSDSRCVCCVSLRTHVLGHVKRPNHHVWMQMWSLYNKIHKQTRIKRSQRERPCDRCITKHKQTRIRRSKRQRPCDHCITKFTNKHWLKGHKEKYHVIAV